MVTGGAGYKGCVLVRKLLNAGYEVVVYDCMLFGSQGLPVHSCLQVVDADIRDGESYAAAVKGCDSVIHLACISNDPSFELDEALSTTINYDCFEPLVLAARKAGVQRFVYSNIERDGMLEGPDLSEVQRVAGTVRGTFIYSGGVSALDDLHALVALRQVNLAGVIVGKALYERRFEVAEAQEILDGDRTDGGPRPG